MPCLFRRLFIVMLGIVLGYQTRLPAIEPVKDFLQLPADVTLGNCSAVAINSRGEIHVFHRAKQPILVFDSAGKFLRSWGDDVIETAHGLRIDRDNNVWATDIGNHRVFKFNPQGEVLLTLGTGEAGEGTEQFNKPTDIAFGADGEFYVADGYGNSRVLKFSPNGGFLSTWGQAGSGEGEFRIPHAIVIDRQGRVVVGDRENNRIQIFNADGKLLEMWNGFAPYGLALNRLGQTYVADGRAHQVLKLNLSGGVVQRWGKQGAEPGQFDLPHMLTFDARGNLFVTEIAGKRLQKFIVK